MKLLYRIEAHRDRVKLLALDRAGKVLVTAGADGVKTWDMEKGKPPIFRAASPHLPAVTALALAADGKRLFLAGSDRMIRAIDPGTLKPLGQFNRHSKTITRLAASADGKHLASAGAEGSVKLWSIAEMRETAVSPRPRESPSSYVLAVAFSADDRLLATGGIDAVVRVHDLDSRRERFAFRQHDADIRGVAFLPGKQGLLSIDHDGVVCRHDLQTGVLRHCRRLDGDVTCFAASPDAAVVACGSSSGVVRLLDPSGAVLRTTRAHGTRVTALAFSPDGRALLSGGSDGSVSLTDVPTGASRPCATQLLNFIWSVVFSHDGQELLACDAQGFEAVWDRQREPVRQPVKHSWGSILVRDPRRKGFLRLRAGGDGSLVVQHDNFRQNNYVSETQPAVLACSHDGRLAAIADVAGVVSLLKIQEGVWQRLGRLTGHAHGVHALAFSPSGGPADGKRLACGDGVRVRLLDETGCQELAVLSGHDGLVLHAVFSPDGRTLATASLDGTVGLWDGLSGRRRARLVGAVFPVRAVAFSPDGRTLAAGGGRTTRGGEVLFWDVESGKRRGALPTHQWAVRGLAFAANDRLITVSGDGYFVPGALKMWDVGSRKELFHAIHHAAPITALALSEDGKQLATAGNQDPIVRLWEIRRDALLLRHTLRPAARQLPYSGRLGAAWSGTDAGTQANGVLVLAFSPDGRTLAAANRDGDVSLWQPELGRSLGRLLLPGLASSLAFHPGNQVLAVGENGGRMRLLTADREVRHDPDKGRSDSDKDLRAEIDVSEVKAKKALADFLVREGDAAGEREILAQMENDLDRLLAQAPDSRPLQEQQLVLQSRLGENARRDPSIAKKHHARAAEIASRLLAAEPARPFNLYARMYTQFLIGYSHYQAGRLDEAIDPLETAVAACQQLAAQAPDPPDLLLNLGSMHLLLGRTFRTRKQPGRALANCRAAVLSIESFGLRTGRFTRDVRRLLAEALDLDCACAHELPPSSRAEANQRAAHRLRIHELAEQVVLHEPDSVDLRRWATSVCGGRWDAQKTGYVAGKVVYSDEADDRFRQGVIHYKALIRLQPGEKKHGVDLLSWLLTWAKMLEAGRRFDRMEKVGKRLVEESGVLRDKEPTNSAHHFNCLVAVQRLIAALIPQKRYADASRWIRTAAREVEAVRSLEKDSLVRLRQACGLILDNLPEMEALQGNYEKAGAAAEERMRWPFLGPDDRLAFAESLAHCADMVRQDGRLPLPVREKNANQQARRAIQLLREAVAEKPSLRPKLAARPALAGLRDRDDFKELVGKQGGDGPAKKR